LAVDNASSEQLTTQNDRTKDLDRH